MATKTIAKKDRRAVTSAENGAKGGRPIASTTLMTQQMRAILIEEVHKNFDAMVKPQIENALKGELPSFKDLLDRVGLKPVEVIEQTNTNTIQNVFFDAKIQLATREYEAKLKQLIADEITEPIQQEETTDA